MTLHIKHGKEIMVAILFVVATVLLYFGLNYLKGINIFKHTNTYVAVFESANGLVEQSNVYIKGYKVGMVDRIVYDFSQEKPFTVVLSTNPDIKLPEGTVVALVPDGLLGGEALELRFPEQLCEGFHHDGDTLPTTIEAGLIDGIVGGLTEKLNPILDNLNPIMINLDSIVLALKNNLTEEQIASIVKQLNGTLAHANGITGKLDNMMAGRIPHLLDSIQLVVDDVHEITANLSEVDFRATILKVDSAVDGVNGFVDKVNSTDGTVGLLLNDKELYVNINNTVSSADSLLTDLKAHPKRYVHFSLFGKKDK